MNANYTKLVSDATAVTDKTIVLSTDFLTQDPTYCPVKVLGRYKDGLSYTDNTCNKIVSGSPPFLGFSGNYCQVTNMTLGLVYTRETDGRSFKKYTNAFTVEVRLDCNPWLQTNTTYQTSLTKVHNNQPSTLTGVAVSDNTFPIVSTQPPATSTCTVFNYEIMSPGSSLVSINSTTGQLSYLGALGLENNLVIRATATDLQNNATNFTKDFTLS